MLHKTKGIVLRSVKYRETSLVVTIYTELFGIQSYIVNSVRSTGKKSQGKAGYFQPASLLDLVVYHNELKNLQRISEYKWSCIYHKIFFDVRRNAVALFMAELLQRCLKQPEANPELFRLAEQCLHTLDNCNDTVAGNLPLFFALHLAAELGFRMHGQYAETTPILDLQEGQFVAAHPAHQHYLEGYAAAATAQLLEATTTTQLQNIALNQTARRLLLHAYQTYFALHLPDFGSLKSVPVLQEVLG
jgi:DNA repair protein RecO (recombination protein O)